MVYFTFSSESGGFELRELTWHPIREVERFLLDLVCNRPSTGNEPEDSYSKRIPKNCFQHFLAVRRSMAEKLVINNATEASEGV